MKDKMTAVCVALAALCFIYIAVRLVQSGEVSGFATGFAGVLCGAIIRGVYERRKK